MHPIVAPDPPAGDPPTVGGSFARTLVENGFFPRREGPWLRVGETTRPHGWKLHLSSVPTEARHLLRTVAPLLRGRATCFKVAADEEVLVDLNSGLFGRTQIGKFLTVYPESDDVAVDLARRIVQLTEGLSGPHIPTDRWLGGTVHTRFGAFQPVVYRDRMGREVPGTRSSDGRLRPDSYAVPFSPPRDQPDPFEGWPEAAADTGHSRLLGPGYLVIDVLRSHPKGSVFRALDLRRQEEVGLKVLKQGRAHCLSDLQGRDLRQRLRRQQELHDLLASRVPIPEAAPYFEVDDCGYLPLESVDGESIESFAVTSRRRGAWSTLDPSRRSEILDVLERVVAAVARLHHAGFVHRDLSPSNVWVGPGLEVRLLDLELTHAVEDPSPPFQGATPGFASPQQERGDAPCFADDVFSLGCLALLCLAGIDPRYLLFGGRPGISSLAALVPGAAPGLLRVVHRAVHPRVRQRPGLEELAAAFARRPGDPKTPRPRRLGSRDDGHAPLDPGALRRTLDEGTAGLLDGVLRSSDGLWLSRPLEEDGGPGVIPGFGGAMRLYPHASRGVAGALYAVARLSRCGLLRHGMEGAIESNLTWLRDKAPHEPLPGLHFGRAGVAVAYAELIAGGLAPRSPDLVEELTSLLRSPPDWPDITHGAAGQALAALLCADRLSLPGLEELAVPHVEYLVREQAADGSWQLPPGVEGVSGQVFTGFAHGAAGIAYLLAEADRRFRRPDARQAWQRAAEWLSSHALAAPVSDGLEWEVSTDRAQRWTWWCHGGPGIALTFLRLFEQEGDEHHADLARRALRAIPRRLRYGNASQCHGLAGLGEIYLEAHRVLDEPEWKQRADDLIATLIGLGHRRRGTCVWPVQDDRQPTADLMAGCGGILHVFLRRLHRGHALSLPLLFDPLANPEAP